MYSLCPQQSQKKTPDQKLPVRKGNFKTGINLILFFFLLTADLSLLAQDPVFVANVSATKVAQHSVFDVQFELQNATGSAFQAPGFQDFRVVGGPSIGSSTMIVNGEVSRSQSWSYSLLAAKAGKFIIGPATVVAGRKKFSTRPITIEVVAAKDLASQGSSSPSKEPVILKAELDARTYYPGQQIILTYRLLFRENVQTVSTLQEDDYGDFFIQHFSDFSREATIETVNGLQFTSRIVKSLALFAHQSGTYTIDPMVMSVGINAPFPGNQGFFTMRRIQDVQVATEPLQVTILPLPSDAPTTFSGAVGDYTMRIIPGSTDITTDQAFSFQLELTGNGDARRWEVPRPSASGSFETYEPKILEDKVFDAGNQVSHFRVVDYKMIPASPGEYKVYVPFTYFDPARKQYVTITSDTISLHVTQGTGLRADSLPQQGVQAKPVELMPVRSVWLQDKFWVSPLHLLLFGLILSGSAFGVFTMYKRKREDQIPEAEKVRKTAGQRAISQYNQLEKHMQEMTSGDFFARATEVYYTFLMDRFMIPSSELDEARLPLYLERSGVPGETAERTLHFFRQCLAVRYGGIPGGYSREEMLKECRDMIGLLEG
jgi:hypothetical protein